MTAQNVEIDVKVGGEVDELLLVLRRRRHRNRLAAVLLVLLLLAALLLGLGYGAVSIPPDVLLRGLLLGGFEEQRQELVLFAIRLPRVLLGALVGAGLAVAGASLQGLFRNPLADPGLIGVMAGAGVAAAATIVLTGLLPFSLPAPLASLLLPAAAFLGALATTLLVYRLAQREGRTDVPTLLLAGVAINAIAGAGIGMLIFMSNDQQLRDITFWTMGSLAGVTWDRLLPVLPFFLLPLLLLPRLGRLLNALLLGEEEAHHLGFAVEAGKRRVILLSALVAGAGVALAGTIGFVGLVVPHLVRLALGPDNRLLLPASALLGAALLLLADLVARTLVLPAELPIGIVTSCVGGPFFLWLLLRARARGSW